MIRIFFRLDLARDACRLKSYEVFQVKPSDAHAMYIIDEGLRSNTSLFMEIQIFASSSKHLYKSK